MRWWQARSERLGRWDMVAFWAFSSWMSAMTMACVPWAANLRAVSSPMLFAPSVIMATLPWSLLFEDVECVLSLLREELESYVRRERKNQLKKWEERESRIKNIILVLAFVSVPLQICNGTNTNAKYLQHLKHLLWGIFLVFGVPNVPNIWHLAHLL